MKKLLALAVTALVSMPVWATEPDMVGVADPNPQLLQNEANQQAEQQVQEVVSMMNEGIANDSSGFNLEGSLNSNIGNTNNDSSYYNDTSSSSYSDSSSSVNNGTTHNYSGSQVSQNNSVVKTQNGASAASAVAPSMGTSGYDSCSQGLTGAVSAPGFGLSMGKHVEDSTCEIIKLSKLMYSMGLKDAGLALAMQDERVAQAIAVSNPALYEKLRPLTKKEAKAERKTRKHGPRRK